MRVRLLCAGLLSLLCAPSAGAQIPDTFTNLQVLPGTISRDSLVAIMRNFSFALGVRCQYCHVGGDGISFEGVRFADDDDEDKRKARYMLRMLARVNGELLSDLPHRDQPPVQVQCVTCHRGLPRPRTLEAELHTTHGAAGIDSAVAHYRQLRAQYFGSGTYDFGAQTLIEVAGGFAKQGQPADAERMLQLNLEFSPNHVGTYASLYDVSLLRSDTAAAIAALEKILELQPQNTQARQRLEQLRRRQPPRTVAIAGSLPDSRARRRRSAARVAPFRRAKVARAQPQARVEPAPQRVMMYIEDPPPPPPHVSAPTPAASASHAPAQHCQHPAQIGTVETVRQPKNGVSLAQLQLDALITHPLTLPCMRRPHPHRMERASLLHRHRIAKPTRPGSQPLRADPVAAGKVCLRLPTLPPRVHPLPCVRLTPVPLASLLSRALADLRHRPSSWFSLPL